MPGRNTLKEIHEQFDLWKSLYEDTALLQRDVESNFPIKEYDEIVFVGAGSSFHLANSAAAAFQRITGENCRALPASEALFFHPYHLKKERRYLGVFFSRSGETTETLRAMELLKTTFRMGAVVISCEPASSMCKSADLSFPVKNCREASLIMTKSFTGMLFVSCLFAVMYGERFSHLTYIEQLSEEGRAAFEWHKPAMDTALETLSFERATYLGGGPFEGAAREASLKLDEMACRRSKCWNPMELRHGPMAAITPEDLIILFHSSSARDVELGLLRDARRIGARAIVLTDQKDASLNELADCVIVAGRGFPEELRPILYMPFAQYLACRVAQRLGIDPDAPQHLTRVVTL